MRATCFVFLCGAAIALSAAAGPSAARAAPLVCRITGADADGVPTYRCGGLVSCESALECDGETFGPEAVCQSYDEDAPGAFCRASCGTIVGCAESTDCPDFGGVATPVCVRFDASRGEPSGLCVYRGIGIHYCAAVEEPAVLRHYWTTCHTRADGTLTSNYFEGDCDGDGCANGDDSTPCVAGEESCVFGTRGRLCEATATDAGVPVADGGASGDGGVNAPDAAASDEDGGTSGSFDAGGDTMDAGARPPGVGFNGGGGCRCAAPGGGDASPGASALLAVAVLATIRARRSRRRS